MIWVPVLRTAMAAASGRQSAGWVSAAVIAGPAGASAGGGTSSLLRTPGVRLRTGPAIVAPRAVPVRLPFAAGHQGSGNGRPGPTGPDRGDR